MQYLIEVSPEDSNKVFNSVTYATLEELTKHVDALLKDGAYRCGQYKIIDENTMSCVVYR